MKKTIPTSIRISAKALDVLKNNAKEIGVSRSSLIERLILAHDRILNYNKISNYETLEPSTEIN